MGPELVEDGRQGLGPWARARLGKSPLGGDYSRQHVRAQECQSRKALDAPPRRHGGGHRATVGGQIGTPPVAPRVLCAAFDDSPVEEGLGEDCRHIFPGACGRPFLGIGPVRTANCCDRFPSCTRQGLRWALGNQGDRLGLTLRARTWGGVQETTRRQTWAGGRGRRRQWPRS